MTRPAFYFDRYEDRRPEEPLEYSRSRELLYQFVAVLNLVFGAWYLTWRWTDSLNPDAMWFSLALVIAESCAFFGVVLFTVNLWKDQPVEVIAAPATLADCLANPNTDSERPLVVDVFYPTYDEDPELVRLSILDGKALTYPHELDLRIHVLDDGRRDAMRRVAEEEGVNYITRQDNVGFKAGNMRNGMELTSGDFLVICDADTRVFPNFLEETMGYFRDPNMAWVQTPQWFFDLDEGQRLPQAWGRHLGGFGRGVANCVEALLGPITVGKDPFASDPKLFYDVLQRRRNWANAAFCCGAGSLHRREAVMESALRRFADEVEQAVASATGGAKEEGLRGDIQSAARRRLITETEMTPYKFHVSEDIYTSVMLHEDRDRDWHSVIHPRILSKMLSPQDLQSWIVQQFKYAGGTLDIAIHDNPIFRRGLTLPQRLMYGMTFWSYLGGLWNALFLFSPVIYLSTGISPVSAYTTEFFLHIVPFLVLNEFAGMTGMWGVPGYQAKASYLARFSMSLRALWTVVRGQKISFPTTPKDRQEGTFGKLVLPQIAVIVLTLGSIGAALMRYSLGGNIELSGILVNALWGIYNCAAMWGYVRAAYYQPNFASADERPEEQSLVVAA